MRRLGNACGARRLSVALVLATLLAPRFARAQAPAFLDVGSEQERYDRLLQITGLASPYPWTARSLSPGEQARLAPADTNNPWLGGADRDLRTGELGPMRWALLPAHGATYFNSAFPYGGNDGPVWQGRGATVAFQTGIAAQWGHLSLQFEPMVFEAQNAAFPLMRNGESGSGVYANGFAPATIDFPQRFGPSAYGRLDPGQSTLRLDLWPVAVGFSTANEFWGPAVASPLILGNNAAGFAHVFLGTAHPWNVGVGTVYGRVIYGRLEESAYAPANPLGASRFASGLVGSFMPRGAHGLELGVTRFFHVPWPQSGLTLADLTHPFEGILKQSLATAGNGTGDDPGDNQLASVYFRWPLPRSGIEVYGEYGREDHNWDSRDFWEEIDHDATYTIGLQRVWQRTAARWYVLRAELLNSRISHLQAGRLQINWYVHTPIVQGHTELGQILGAPEAFGGGGSTLALDRYDPSGRWTATLGRAMRFEYRRVDRSVVPDSADVQEFLGAERMLRTSRGDLTAGLTGVWDFNRDFRGDRFNLNLAVSARVRWP